LTETSARLTLFVNFVSEKARGALRAYTTIYVTIRASRRVACQTLALDILVAWRTLCADRWSGTALANDLIGVEILITSLTESLFSEDVTRFACVTLVGS